MSAPDDDSQDADAEPARGKPRLNPGRGESASRASRPGDRIPMSSGSWMYRTQEGANPDGTPVRGVYMAAPGGSWLWMAPLPFVHARLVRRGADGRVTSVGYRVSAAADGPATVVDREQVRSDEWAELIGLVISPDDKIVKAAAAAIKKLGDQAPEVELAARWRDGQLQAPPADVGPPGYGQTSGTEDEARRRWRVLVATMAGNPRLALAVGAAVGGYYFGTLTDRAQPFICYLTGAARQGKSTALMLGAGVFGNPTEVHIPMNVSRIGVTAFLGELGELPAFLDELGASTLSLPDLESLIFGITQGGKRTVGAKTGGTRQSPPWRSVAVVTGNDSIVGRITNEGVSARVVEIRTPIVATAEDADTIDALLFGQRYPTPDPGCWGWPYKWLTDDPRVEEFHAAVAAAERDLPLPAGGVPQTLGRHLALAVAGAERLAELCGGEGARDAALVAARECLDANVEEITERGATAGDRLYSAVMQALASRPAAFPAVDRYEALVSGETSDGLRLASEIDGLVLEDGHVGVLTSRLAGIAADNNMNDDRTALRDLRDRGILLTSPGMGLRWRQRVLGRRTELYLFARLHDVVDGQAPDVVQCPFTAAEPAPAVDEMDRAVQLLQRTLGATTVVPAPLGVATGPVADDVVLVPAELPYVDPEPAAATEPVAPALEVPAPMVVPAQDEQPQTRPVRPAPTTPPEADVEKFMRRLQNESAKCVDITEEIAVQAIANLGWAFESPKGGNLGRPLVPSATPAVTGYRLFSMIMGKSGRQDDRLYRITDVEYPEVELVHNWRRDLTGTERTMPYVIGMDVHFQFVGAASSAMLGTGRPVHLGGRKGEVDLSKMPGYYRATVDPKHPAVRGEHNILSPLVAGDGWMVQPVAERLFKDGAIKKFHEKWEWQGEGKDLPRKWLGLWAIKLRDTRALLRQYPDRPGCVAAAEWVKLMAAAFLAGWLRSEENNTELYRRDWSDTIIGQARANQHYHVVRAWDKGKGMAPIGQYKDMMYYMVESPDVIPPGLQLSDSAQPGKWKLERAVPAAAVADALATGGIGDLNSAMKHAHEER